MKEEERMKIVDLGAEDEALYFNCLSGNPELTAETGDYKRDWYRAMKPRGLRVKLALDGEGEPVGMVQYLPVEESIVAGRDLYFLYCIWVLNDKKYRGNHQKKGYGSALLAAFEDDARQSGKKGVAAWGLRIPAFMRASWFEKRGYREAERQGIQSLLWKTWDETAEKPAWILPKKTPAGLTEKSTVTCFCGGWCPEVNKAFMRAKRAAEDIGAKTGRRVDLTEIDTKGREAYAEWGIGDALFIGGREMPLGPAPSYGKIARAIKRGVKKTEKEKS
jgi:GNAT superfamily N-acetyltransferase